MLAASDTSSATAPLDTGRLELELEGDRGAFAVQHDQGVGGGGVVLAFHNLGASGVLVVCAPLMV